MSTEFPSPDAIVVGGGIIGCTLAYELQKRKIQTLLIDQGQIGRESTWASAGIIGPPSGETLPPHRAELADRSEKRYARLLESVAEDSAFDPSYLRIGKVLVAFTEAEVEIAQSRVLWQVNHGYEARWIEPDEVREIEPTIPAETILGAYYTPDGGGLTGHRVTEAIADAFRNAGGEVREYTAATGLLLENDRITGVDTPQGPIHSDTVALCAGAWTRFLGGSISRYLPVIPVKGQMIGVVPESNGSRPRHVTGTISGGYVVPRVDGTVAVGASLEHRGFDKRVTAKAFSHATALMEKVSPALLQAQFSSAWAGLRPGTEDDSPIMGPVPGYEGLWVSTGHFRTGIQLAPGSAVLMADAISNKRVDNLLSQFSLERFG
jgi:glycine oxidase